MKLNNLSRLTALLLALTMILPTFAVAEEGTDFDQITEDYLNSVAETVVLIDTLVADGYCETCAADVASAGLTAWPVSGYNCLYEHLDDLSASAAYDMLVAYYNSGNSGSAEDAALYEAYINSHNNHFYNDQVDYPKIICDCGYLVLQPGNGKHDAACPWVDEEYVTSQTVTDQNGTGITVTGDIPAGVKLEVKTATKPSIDTLITMIDPSKYAEEPTVLAYDITLTQADGTAWQPTTAVTVKVPGAYSTVPEKPLAEAVHMLADGGHEVLAATVNADGSVTFDATGFSTYYVVAGTQRDGSGSDTFYILRGTKVELTNVNNDNYTVTYPDGKDAATSGASISRNGTTLTFAATDATVLGKYSINIDSTRTATIHVLSPQAMFELDSISKAVYFTVLEDSYTVPTEPMHGGSYNWYYIHKNGTDYTFNRNQWFDAGQYQSNPNGFLDLNAIANSPALQQSINVGQNVIGVVDSGLGIDTKDCVTISPEEWHNILVQYVDKAGTTLYINDGTKRIALTSEMVSETLDDGTYRYQVYPYVIKLVLNGSNQNGWHVDCAVADTKTYHVSYSHNLPTTAVVNGKALSMPATKFYAPYTTGVSVDKMQLVTNSWSSTPINVGDEISIYDSQLQQTFTYTFVGWNTAPDGSGNSYKPDDLLPEIKANVTLYAIWESDQDTGSLRIDKDVVFADENDTRKDDDVSYTFAITLSGDGGAKYPYTIYAADGNIIENFNAENGIQNNGIISLKDGQHAIVFNVPAGSVTVTETATNNATPSWQVGSGSVTEGNSTTVTVTAGYTTNVTCTNTYVPLTGTLTITKIVSAAEGVTPPEASFTFIVTLNGITDYTGITYTIGDSTTPSNFNGSITLTDGQTATITGLPADTDYTVREETVPAFTTKVAVADDKGDDEAPATTANTLSGEIDAAGTDEVTFTNTYQTGNLVIRKVVDPKTGAPADTFKMNVTLSLPTTDSVKFPDSYSVSYSNPTATGSISSTGGTIQLQAGQSATIVGLPHDTIYEVEEATPPEYYSAEVGYAFSDPSREINSDNDTVEVTNTYNTGTLEITKEVKTADNSITAPADEFKITVKLTLPNGLTTLPDSVKYKRGASETKPDSTTIVLEKVTNGETITISGLPVGTEYAVVESDKPDYYKPTGEVKETDNRTIVAGENEVTITNEYQSGNLQIKKAVTPTSAGATLPTEDKFTIVVTLTKPEGSKVDWNSDVTYAIEGATGAGYAVNGNVITFTGILKDSVINITGLPAGTTYTITEAETYPSYYKKAGEITTPVAIVAGQTAAVTLTNTYHTSNLVVEKEVRSENAGTTAPDDEFELKVTFGLPTDHGATAQLPTSYTKTDKNGNTSTVNFTVENGVVTISNVKAGDKFTFNNLPAGTRYKVEESTPPSYYTKFGEVTTVTPIEAGSTETVKITNTYYAGSLTVEKNVTSDPTVTTLPDERFAIDVKIELPANSGTALTLASIQSCITMSTNVAVELKDGVFHFTNVANASEIKFDNLPYGTKYTVTEITPPGYYEVAIDHGNATIGEQNQNPEVIITNTYKTGTLKITKKVEGNAPADEFAITVTLTLPKGMTTLPDSVKYKRGENETKPDSTTIVLDKVTNGDTITIYGLPVGTQYNVTEVTPPSYYTSDIRFANDDKAITNASEVDEVTVTNTYNTGSLTVTKSVTSNPAVATLPQDTFTIDVELELPEDNGAKISLDHIADSISSTNGKGATVTQTASGFQITGAVDGTQIVFNNLPHGTKYSVAEIGQPGYFDVKYNGAATAPTNVEIDAISTTSTTKVTSVAITNTYLTGDLEITKVVDGTGMPADDSFTIDVAFKLPEGNATIPTKYTLSEGVSASDQSTTAVDGVKCVTVQFTGVQHTDRIVITGIPYGTTYSVTEETPAAYYTEGYTYDDSTEKKIGNETADKVTVTNTYITGSLDVTKEVVGVTAPRGENGKGTDEFSFTLKLTLNSQPVKATIKLNDSEETLGENGEYTFTLTDGETAHFTQLPANVQYTVTETAHADYTTTVSSNSTGTIVADTTDTVEVKFTNTYKVGALKITKNVSGSIANANDTFVFNVSGPGIDGTLKVVLKGGESVTIPDLKIGTYTVTEDTSWSWRYTVTTPTGGSASAAVIENEIVEVTFTNKVDNPYWLDGSAYADNRFGDTTTDNTGN